MTDWRNWLIGIIGASFLGWLASAVVAGRWLQRREDGEEGIYLRVKDLEHRFSETAQAVNDQRVCLQAIRSAMEAANHESSRLTGMVQILIGKAELNAVQMATLDAWVRDLRRETR